MVSVRPAASCTGFDLHPDQCRVVDVQARVRDDVSADVRVDAFALLAEGRVSPMLSSKLARLRQDRRFTRDAWVAIWGLRSVHQFLRLPEVETADLEAMSVREAQHALSTLEAEGGRPLVALMVGADVHVGTRRRRDVSLTAVAEPEIARQIQPLVDAGFNIRGVCTPAMALAAVARRHTRATSDMAAAYVALESNAMCLAIVRDGVLLSCREIPWEFADSADAVRERLADELRRTLLFFRQSFRTVVERVVLCGGMPNLRALTAPLGSALNVPVETLDSLTGLDAEVVPEPAEMFRSTVPALWPAIAIASQSGEPPNLLRGAPRVRLETRPRIGLIAAGVVATALIAATWYLFGRTGRESRAPVQPAPQATSPPSPPAPAVNADATPTPRPAEANAQPQLFVSSILYSSQRRLAIVNGRIVRAGERIGSWTILYIEPRAVVVQSDDGTKRTLELRGR